MFLAGGNGKTAHLFEREFDNCLQTVHYLMMSNHALWYLLKWLKMYVNTITCAWIYVTTLSIIAPNWMQSRFNRLMNINCGISIQWNSIQKQKSNEHRPLKDTNSNAYCWIKEDSLKRLHCIYFKCMTFWNRQN